MGTNFYLRRKLSQKEKEIAKQYIDEDKYDEIRKMLPEDIHIGKRSYGWKFLWDAHFFEYFEPTKESLFDWLESGQIIDECGDEFTFDQFINDELKGRLDKGWDIESYYIDRPEDKSSWYDFSSRNRYFYQRCPNLNINVNRYGEFYIDGLRFTVSEDFS